MHKLFSFFAALATFMVSFQPWSSIPLATAQATERKVYVPFVATHEFIADDVAIWHPSDVAELHDIALLRKAFTLAAPLTSTELHIFADTRYELWVDGVWIGRGPARFSSVRREYDVHSLGTLTAGRHVLAVLVQWAPNTRRSASLRPELRAHIEGRNTAGKIELTARSNESWRSNKPGAWLRSSHQVHAWNLIGPTEVLDLRQLSSDWYAPDFDDSGWPAAAVLPKIDSQPKYARRSIPFLDHSTMRPAVHDAGYVSPQSTLVHASSTDASTASAIFSVANAQSLVIDVFGSALGTAPPATTLDGAPLSWVADAQRPGVYSANALIDAGTHTLNDLSGSVALLHSTFDDVSTASPGASPLAAPGVRMALAQPQSEIFLVDASDTYTYRLASTPSYILFDLGQVRHGRLAFEASGPVGTVVDVGWDERLQPGADWILPHPGPLHPEWSEVDSWTLDASARTVRTIDARTGRYVLVVAWGGPLTIADVRFENERFPVTQTGSFSADTQLEKIWQTGVNTTRINMLDAYADPWRERGQWWGDTFVVDRVNEVAFGDTRLLRRGLQAFADEIVDGRPPAFAPNSDDTLLLDYGMLWIQSLDSYLSRSNDKVLVRSVYPQMRALLGYLEGYRASSSFMLDIPKAHWSGSALIDFPAFYADVGTGGTGVAGLSTPVNAMYLGSLRAASRIAARIDETAQAAQWNAQAAQLRTEIHARLYDAASGCYWSTEYAGVRGNPNVHAQGWALAYDVPPAENRAAVADCLLERVGSDPRNPGYSPYGAYWILEGLAAADRIAEGVELVRRNYGAMLDRGATTWWENFTADTRYTSALSHGWGSGPTWFLSTHVLGVKRETNGAIRIAPAIDVLNFASGSVPVDGGTVDITWRRISCEATEFTMRSDQPVQMRLPESMTIASIWTNQGRVSAESLRSSDSPDMLTIEDETIRIGLDHACITPAK